MRLSWHRLSDREERERHETAETESDTRRERGRPVHWPNRLIGFVHAWAAGYMPVRTVVKVKYLRKYVWQVRPPQIILKPSNDSVCFGFIHLQYSSRAPSSPSSCDPSTYICRYFLSGISFYNYNMNPPHQTRNKRYEIGSVVRAPVTTIVFPALRSYIAAMG